MNCIVQRKNKSITSLKIGNFSKCNESTFMYDDHTLKKKVLPTSKQIFTKSVLKKRRY